MVLLQWKKLAVESVDMIISLYENNFPVRFGILLYSSKYVMQLEDHSAKEDGDKFEDDVPNMIIRLFSYIKGNYGIQMAFKFLSNVNKLRLESDDHADDAHLELHHVEAAFVETILPKVKSPPQEILLKLEKEPDLKELSQESSKLVFKLGLSKIQCSLLMNGLVIDPTYGSVFCYCAGRCRHSSESVMDKASVLGEAIKYLKQIQGKVVQIIKKYIEKV